MKVIVTYMSLSGNTRKKVGGMFFRIDTNPFLYRMIPIYRLSLVI